MNKTKKSIRGTIISTLFLVLQMIFSFWRTKAIITVYGTDINSISQAANQIYAYLSLLESGLCAAYQYKMYNPFVKKNYDELYGLYENLNKAMHKVAGRMLIIVLMVSAFYPLILAENSLSWMRATLIFLLVGVRCVLPYWIVVAKKNILVVEEKQYIASSIDSMVNVITVFTEVCFVKYLGFPIEITLIAGCGVILLSYVFYYQYVKCFWVEHPVPQTKTSNSEMSVEANKMTKDIIVHQICGLANKNIDILILSAVNVFQVTVYANYNSIMNYPVNIINGGIKNVRATIGLKFASGEKNAYEVFREMLSFNVWCAGIVSAVFFSMINDFIFIWLGKEFLLDKVCIILFTLILLRRLVAEAVYSVRDANGLYKESKYYTLVTAILNTVISLLLVKPLGVKGLLIGTFVSAYFVMDLGNNRLVFHGVFDKKMYIYFDLLLAIINIIMTAIFGNWIGTIIIVSSWITFIIKAVFVSVVSGLLMSILIGACDQYSRKFVKRVIRMRR
ncbi:lipopolysaccharide biosynthesis protein [Agathobacter sp.]